VGKRTFHSELAIALQKVFTDMCLCDWITIMREETVLASSTCSTLEELARDMLQIRS
jgi:hypothetical protein